MKKILCFTLCLAMLVGALALVSCREEPKLKLGMGVYTNVSAASDADGDVSGEGKATVTAAAVTLDADGKIVACVLDTADLSVKYTAEGKAVANQGFKTKGESGKDYNMVQYGGASKEWYEQADAFNASTIGKTASEIAAMMASDNYGVADVKDAGCTILVNGFVKAAAKIG